MIPKIIHQIWIGDKPLPDIWKPLTKSWKDKNPEYQYILWDEQKLKPLDRYNYLSSKIQPTFVSDIFRYKLLHLFGGFYFDVDFNCLKPIREWEYDFDEIDFFSIEYGGTTQNGLMASSENSPVSQKLYNDIPRDRFLSGDVYGPWWLNKVLKETDHEEDVNIFIEVKNTGKFLPEWHGIPPSGNKNLYTANDSRYSTWYPSKFCPHTNIKNSDKNK